MQTTLSKLMSCPLVDRMTFSRYFQKQGYTLLMKAECSKLFKEKTLMVFSYLCLHDYNEQIKDSILLDWAMHGLIIQIMACKWNHIRPTTSFPHTIKEQKD